MDSEKDEHSKESKLAETQRPWRSKSSVLSLNVMGVSSRNPPQCWTKPLLWSVAMGSNPGAFPISPCAGPAAQPGGSWRTDTQRSFLSHILLQPTDGLAFPWAFALLGHLCSLRGMLGNSPLERLWCFWLRRKHNEGFSGAADALHVCFPSLFSGIVSTMQRSCSCLVW